MKPNFCVILILGLCMFSHTAWPQSQADLDQQAQDQYDKADKELNVTYKKLMALLDDQGKQKLVAAERAWVAYRDAQADFDADAQARGGTMEPEAYSLSALDLTQQRIKELQKIIKDDER
jgi:uncharacterized protein YecT (DUF1311 family)